MDVELFRGRRRLDGWFDNPRGPGLMVPCPNRQPDRSQRFMYAEMRDPPPPRRTGARSRMMSSANCSTRISQDGADGGLDNTVPKYTPTQNMPGLLLISAKFCDLAQTANCETTTK